MPPVPEARRIRLRGHVQGVGFRPFVYRLATEHGLSGYVQNQLGEVEVVAAGPAESVNDFIDGLVDEAPPLSSPSLVEVTETRVPATSEFRIIDSLADADAQVFVPPDYFMCEECRRELGDPADRRHAYPFINCTQCGPRYTLIETLPYDRLNTSMTGFPLCPDCEAEYLDPNDRRFHAEPVACAACGPRLAFERVGQETIAATADALAAAVAAIRAGEIVAIKGIGGYHLLCDALDEQAVARLRQRKQRPAKPLAVMFPVAGDDGLDVARRYADIDAVTAHAARGPVRPIVLAARRADCGLAKGIAPGLGEIGVFLPYSPLHQLLLDALDGPVVATSGNISGEPVLTDNDEALRRLAPVADAFLQHDRPIVRPADDPVFRRIAGAMRPLRIGRGCAPRELTLPWRLAAPTLAVGGHMKGTLALAWERRVVVSPHIGEMDSPRSLDVFEQVAADLQSLYGVQAERIVCDAHPGYTTHRWARRQDLPVEEVWHHEAHASALAAEIDRPGEWLVFAWDGVGLGRDGTLWGGEAFAGRAGAWRRFASLRPLRLPGGDKAGREPWRSAAALHWECDASWQAVPDRDGLARTAWQKHINCQTTSAAGRLFDAAAAIVCDFPVASFEAEGPMMLEALCRTRRDAIDLPLDAGDDGILRSDWQPLLRMLDDASLTPAQRAETFHASMAGAILVQARAARTRHGVDRVGLCGGVFQNRFLVEQAIAMLEADGFDVHLPALLPANDAALSFGQAAQLAAREANKNG
ncbi:MAG: carbamoyltransferase HypF [Gammaproteobacteria bacterium]|nr:carbamoyltransferase HypF [Gammaproteobacteria bacterium]